MQGLTGRLLLYFAATCLLQALLANSQTASLPTAWTQGIATNYGGAQDGMNPSSPSFGTLDGSCGYGLLNPNVYPYWTVAALSPSNMYFIAGPSDGCGQCFEIQCLNDAGEYAGRCGSTTATITVTITDSCPQCEANHIDIQALTFNVLAPMAIGRIDMQYRRVDCTPPLPVSIDIDNNVGEGGWLRFVVEKVAGFGSISLVSIRSSGAASWISMDNTFGSAWEVANAPTLPWDFQFTSDSGQSLVVDGLINENGQVGDIPTQVQFSVSGSSGSTSISYDSGAGGPAGGATATPPGATPPAVAATPPAVAATPPAVAATPPAAAATPPAAVQNVAQGGSCPCADVVPAVAGGLTISCAEQAAYGKCDDSWMVSGNYCQLTCGNCPAACSGGSATPPSAAGAAAASGTGASPPIEGATPPTGQTPPEGTSTPPSTATGSVQTFSVEAPPPPPAAAAPSSGGCTDNPPPNANGQTCPQLATSGACYSTIGAGFCLQSCYRPPCASG